MNELLASGAVRKMKTHLADPVEYQLILGENEVPLNNYLGQQLQLKYTGKINCVHCDRKTSKSFSQGYCYPCFRRLAQCDMCIMSPEKCHYAAGTCREPEWGESHCMIDHIVYLANTSGIKVGITRDAPTRWMDQGASQAQPIFRVSNRLRSGLVETIFKNHIADKTNWQTMLKGAAEARDLESVRQSLMLECGADIETLQREHGLQSIVILEDEPMTTINYPVLEHPTKVKSLNLDKTPIIGGTLMGIKGQYLLFDTGVINMRKYGGYSLELSQQS